MENQEMLNAWNQLQSRVELSIRLQLSSPTLPRWQAVQFRARLAPIFDLVVASLAALFIGNFVADEFKNLLAAPITLLPALVLFGFAIFFINVSIRELLLISRLDYSLPLIEMQELLAKLRKLKIQVTQYTLILGIATWFVGPLLLAQMAIGSRVILAFSPAWVIANLVFGAAIAPLIVWAIRKSKYAQSFQDALAGKEILKAERFLDELRQFREN